MAASLSIPPLPSFAPNAPSARLRRVKLRAKLAMYDLRPKLRRSIDIVASGAGLIVLSPLLLTVALLVKLTSKGPIFFFQERFGQHGRRFPMFKFRTMYTDAERRKAELAAKLGGNSGGVRFKMKKDPRITPVGRILRRLSIDELPQLYNVLRGDMTLIGPRPAIRKEVVLYDALALRRLEVPQGLTCLWQVGGRSDLTFEEQVQLDIEYIDTAKATDEVKILAKTVPAVLTGKGAY